MKPLINIKEQLNRLKAKSKRKRKPESPERALAEEIWEEADKKMLPYMAIFLRVKRLGHGKAYIMWNEIKKAYDEGRLPNKVGTFMSNRKQDD